MNAYHTINEEDKKVLNTLAEKFQDYLDYQEKQVMNLTWYTLSSIKTRWYYERQLKNDVDEQDLEQTNRDVHKFITTVDRDIHNLLKEKDPTAAIESYMEDYNDRLFDAISGRDTEYDSDRSIDQLFDPYIELLAELRWKSEPRDIPGSIEYQLHNLRDYNHDLYQFVLSNGVELEELVRNYGSIKLNEELRTELNQLTTGTD